MAKHIALVIVILSLWPSLAHSQTSEDALLEAGESAEVADTELKGDAEAIDEKKPLPYFARHEPELPHLILKNKRSGRYVVGLPTIGYNPDEGVTIGGTAIFFKNRERDNPLFRVAPYGQAISVLGQMTTRGLIRAEFGWDQPYIFDTPWRPRIEAVFNRNPVANYFGIGDDSLFLTFPGTGQVFDSFGAYKDALKQEEMGTANTKYFEYKNTRAAIRGSVEHDFWGGWLRPLIGFQFSRVWIGDYTGDSVNAINSQGDSVKATQNNTHLRDDCISGQAIGCDGGWDNYLKVGFSIDTRNFEPDPTFGLLYENVGEFSLKVMGSSFNYGRWTNTLRAYANILPNAKRPLVLAGRVVWNWQFGDVPFYSMDVLAFNSIDRMGLGGFRTIRGYRQNRFIGPVSLVTNLEMRWNFAEATLWKQDLRFSLAPFFDTGRVFNNIGDVSFQDWKVGGGGGFRLAWNLATVISFDYGVSSEGHLLLIQLDNAF